jgi:hypothetical protein
MVEKRINENVNFLKIDEIRDDLNICFERLNMKANEENDSEVVEDLALCGGQFKRKCRNCWDVGHKSPQDYISKTQQNGGTTEIQKRRLLHLMSQISPFEEKLL